MAFDNQNAPKIEVAAPNPPPEQEKIDKEQLDEVSAHRYELQIHTLSSKIMYMYS